jgi:predicted ATPase
MLARIAYDLRGETPSGPVRDLIVRDVPKIVLTGGPCSGKSSVMTALRNERSNLLQCVPEVATIIIEQVGIKPPIGDRLGMKTFQRTIYRVQLGFEKGSSQQALRDGRSALLLDRGTVDGAAYMENGLRDMEQIFRTSTQDEYDRYHGVICMDVPPRKIYEANKSNNPARYETYEQAAETGRRIREVWSGHPNFRFISNDGSWEDKLQQARIALNNLLSEE